MKKVNKISVLGLWHLGIIYAVGLVEMGNVVIAFDEDSGKISQLNKGTSPIYEPNLDELLKKNLLTKKLSFTHELKDVKNSEIVFLTGDTPLNNQDEVDLSSFYSLVNKIANLLKNSCIVVISSQVPIGTCDEVEKILRKHNKSLEVAYIPENLRLGKAVERFFNPDMIVIGTKKKKVFEILKTLFSTIDAAKFHTDLKTAEMVKHAINSFLATSISFANELGNLSDLAGANFWEIAKIIRTDQRIGHFARVFPGLGFAGGTLARDLRILQHVGKNYGYSTEMIDAVLKVNDKQKDWVVNKVQELFGKNLKNIKIRVLGLTYTANTSTLRRSLSVETINKLLKLNADVVAFDPKVNLEELKKYPQIKIVKSWKELMTDADAVVVMTGWDDFKKLPWKEIRKIIKGPIILDPNNFLAEQNLENCGFSHLAAGKSHEKT